MMQLMQGRAHLAASAIHRILDVVPNLLGQVALVIGGTCGGHRGQSSDEGESSHLVRVGCQRRWMSSNGVAGRARRKALDQKECRARRSCHVYISTASQLGLASVQTGRLFGCSAWPSRTRARD